jgi:surface protein
MNNMFSGATSFRGYGNIFRWDTSQVRTMNGMFQDARVFNQDINRWNTLEVTDMGNMFIAARAYNGAMFSWDTSNVVIMSNMFGQAISFNQPIGRWNTSRVTNMSQMFDGATIFNQPINTLGLLQGESGNEWNTGSVTNMSWMFRGAQQFNQNIGRWNTSQVTDMQSMFQLAQSFNNGLAVEWRFNGFINQDENNRFFIRDIPPFRSISFNNQRRLDTFRSYWIVTTPRQTMNWNTSNVRNMNNMFDEAANFFNVDLRLWRITNDCPTVMFRNFSPMPDQFTPFQVGVAREGAGYT